MFGGSYEAGEQLSVRCNPATCEPINCDTLITYEIKARSNTEAHCERILYTAQAERCVADRCATRDEYCVESSREVVLAGEDLGQCGAIDGCINEVPPNLTARNIGDSCANGRGVCNQGGQCTVNDCSSLNITDGHLCFDQSRVNGRCSFNVSFGVGMGLVFADHCSDVCAESGGVCIGSYLDTTICYEGRDSLNELACDLRQGGDRVCVCEYIYYEF